MTTDVDARERRLRKQAELQSLHTTLANLRDREVTYITAQATLPDLLIQQTTEIRQQIQTIENELAALNDEPVPTPGRQIYREAFEAELNQDFEKALKLYKSAARYTYADASAAARSLRHRIKTAKRKTSLTFPWADVSARRSRRFSFGLLVALLIGVIIIILALNVYFSNPSEAVVTVSPTITTTSVTLTAVVVLNTATPTVTNTPINTPLPSPTATPSPVSAPVNVTPTATTSPTPAPTLKAAPKIIGPRDGLVWKNGAIVFEFEDMNLPDNELYCLNTMRGYDQTLTENWSFPPIGSQQPSIPIEENVFRVAQLQDMRCIVWSAYIGRGSCENVVSESSEERVIGLPEPCQFR